MSWTTWPATTTPLLPPTPRPPRPHPPRPPPPPPRQVRGIVAGPQCPGPDGHGLVDHGGQQAFAEPVIEAVPPAAQRSGHRGQAPVGKERQQQGLHPDPQPGVGR